MQKKECIAMLLAGGQGTRLGDLTSNIAKPAVSFGGKYRIIDFSLSNCINSDIDTVGILVQYRPGSLNQYLGNGAAWDLDSVDGGAQVLSPYATQEGGAWYEGTADAIYHNIGFIDSYNPENVLILSGDHIYRADYAAMLRQHQEKQADLTVSVIEVPWDQASRFGIMTLGEDDSIVKFTEKPKEPDSNMASMGVYIFSWPVLRKALIEDNQDPDSEKDFGKNVIPKLLAEGKRLFAYHFEGYWKDVGTISSYYEAQMELIDRNSPMNIFERGMKIFSNSNYYAPALIGPEAVIEKSLVCNGCVINGKVEHSITASGAEVHSGTVIKDSILLPDSNIGSNCTLIRTIVNEGVRIKDGCTIGSEDGEITVVGHDIL
ncbi:MAG: glucose-1-phosphate adenylyltransferase [Lachnospiraceae bacterium]|nr:glucose-1-phosphate adenylyltransferase [Lachnospiraceae bacterium]